MQKDEIGQKVVGILEKVLDSKEKLPKAYDQDISPVLDSIRFVSLIIEIETTFNMEIDEDDFEISKLDTVEKIIDLVSGYLKE